MKSFLFCLWISLLLMVRPASGGVTQSVISNVATTNYTGLLVAADFHTGHVPDRSVIRGAFTMNFDWDGLTNDTDLFEVSFRFEDEAGAILPIYAEGGGPQVTELTDSTTLNLNFSNFNYEETFTVGFEPAGKLLPNKRYTLRAKWRKKTNSGPFSAWNEVPLHSTASTTNVYLHFQNTTSGDPAKNAVALAALNSWNRKVMIGGSDVQGSFRLTADVFVARYDDFNGPNLSADVPVRLGVALKNSSGTTVWTRPTPVEITINLDGYQGSLTPGANPDTQTEQAVIDLAVPAGVLAFGETYTPVITVTHDDGAGYIADGTTTFDAAQLLRLSGNLYFGSVLTKVRQTVNDIIGQGTFAPLVNPTVLHSNLQIPAGYAYLDLSPSSTFGGTSYTVDIAPNGDATYVGGGQIHLSGTGLTRSAGGISYTIDPTLNSSGGTMDVILHFPDGFGVTTNIATAQVQPSWTFTGLALNAGLTLPPTLNLSTALACYCERLPLWFTTTTLTWTVSSGTLAFGSGIWYDPFVNDRIALNSIFVGGQLANGGSASRTSNIGHFGYMHLDSHSGVTIEADAAGRAQLTGRADIAQPGLFAPHFPLVTDSNGTGVVSLTGGHIEFIDGVVTASSGLDVGNMGLYYNRKTAPPPCSGSATAGFVTVGTPNSLRFTQDGGLAAEVTLDTGGGISFGATQIANQFAHTLPAYTTGWFMMPGHYLPGEEIVDAPFRERPAALLLSGVSKTDGSNFGYTERPDSTTYSGSGLANYAGVNVATTTLTSGGASLIGGYGVSYNLQPPSKHYIRIGGVSGITQADVGSFSILPVPVYGGLGLDLSSYKLSFLDGINQDSLTEGSVMVGGPSNFTLAFESLMLGPTGELTTADLKDTEKDTTKTLDYWQVPFKPVEMRFLQPISEACASPGTGFLSVGVNAQLPLLDDEPVFGVLGFKGSGDLITKADTALAEGTGVDSTFQLPANIPIKGSGGNYTLQAVTPAALNRWEYADADDRPPTGFMSFAGRLEVPFFEALKVHVHANNDSNPNKRLYLMGGWNASDAGPGVGWAAGPSADKTFFNDVEFDADHTGYPGSNAAALNAYRTRPTLSDATYRPRAMKNWYGVVQFDYPLVWENGVMRSSQIVENAPVVLFNINHKVKTMNANRADLQFDAALAPNVELPDLGLSTLLTDAAALTGFNAALEAVAGPGFNFGDLSTPLAALQGVFADQVETALGAALDPALTPAVDLIYNQAVAKYNAANGDNNAAFVTALNAPAVQSQVLGQIQTAAEALLGPGGDLASEAASRVTQVRTQITAFTAKMRPIGVNTTLAESLIYALDSDPANPGAIDKASIGATLVAICDQLDAVAVKLQSVETQITQATSDVSKELDNVIDSQSASLNSISQQSLADVSSVISQLPALPGQLFTDYSVDDMKKKIRRVIRDRFIGSSVTSETQKVFKQHLQTVVSDSLQGVDGILGTLSAGVLARNTPPNTVPSFTSGLGGLSDKLKAASLNGYARINGDSLEELRLDGKVNLGIGSLSGGKPEESGMTMQAFMQVKSIRSDSPAAVCAFGPGAEGLECTVGADNVPLGWAGLGAAPKGYATLKLSFADGGLPMGFDGALGIKGTFGAGGMNFTDPKVIVGASPNQIYAGFALRAEFQGKEVAAKALLGRICEIGTLSQVNEGQGKLLVSLINQKLPGSDPYAMAPYTGGSLYAEGWMPLNELIGIPTTCMLNLRAGVGAGLSVFVPNATSNVLLGTQQLLGLSGQVLCTITVKGTLEMNGAGLINLNAPGDSILSLSGLGNVSAKVGISPLDYTFSKNLGINGTYNMGTGDKSFSVDF
jgi:hypothetical protein